METSMSGIYEEASTRRRWKCTPNRSPPRTPCIRSSGAGAGRGSPPRTPCICSFDAGAGRGPPPRTPCICSSGGCADRHCAASFAPRLPLLRPHRAPAACPRRSRLPPTLRAWRSPHRFPLLLLLSRCLFPLLTCCSRVVRLALEMLGTHEARVAWEAPLGFVSCLSGAGAAS